LRKYDCCDILYFAHVCIFVPFRLYESWSVPFSVLLAVPLGAFGAILALTLNHSLSNNVYAQIGLITLIGLAAKNSILIVEFAKVRVDCGMDITRATLSRSAASASYPDDIHGLYFRCFTADICFRSRCCGKADYWLDRFWRYAGRHIPRNFYCPFYFIYKGLW
jgi:hypothetical protein